MSRPRLVGVAEDSGGKWGQLYVALEESFEVLEIYRPEAPIAVTLRAILGNWKTNLRDRTRESSYSPAKFDAQTRAVDDWLAWRGNDHDAIVQCQTLFAPGDDHRTRPYVIYTDSTHALRKRLHYDADPTPGARGQNLLARERAVSQGAGHVFTMSEFARGSMIDDYGVPPERVTAVGAGVNLTVASPAGTKDRPRAVFVGIDLARKGGHDVLAAWPEVLRAVPDAELVIAGPAPGAAQPGVRWAGRLSGDEVSRLYAESTVFVMPTLWEPWGLVYHEAMAHGLPCIGTDRFAVPEIVAEGETGLLVPPGAPDRIAAALIELLTDPARADALGQEGRRRALRDATWSAVAAKMTPELLRLAAT